MKRKDHSLTEVDELNKLEPLVRVTRRCVEDGDGKTVVVYDVLDRQSKQVLAKFASHCHKELVPAVHHMLQCFGEALTEVPYEMLITVERIKGDVSNLWMVRLMEPVTSRCLHHFEHPEAPTAINGFWDNLDFEATVAAQANSGLEPDIA